LQEIQELRVKISKFRRDRSPSFLNHVQKYKLTEKGIQLNIKYTLNYSRNILFFALIRVLNFTEHNYLFIYDYSINV